MAKYNAKTTGTTQVVVNAQGGEGIKLSPEMEMVSLLASGLDGRFYEKESDRESRLVEVIKTVGKKDPELVAKALVYARSVMGQRSVTHVGAVAAQSVLAGNPLATRFYGKRDHKKNQGGIVYRLDDILEIVAYYFLRNPGMPLPNAMKRGFKNALEAADTYELAKYQGKGRAVSLVDIVNLVRPKPSEKMQDTFKKLMNGELKQFNTAEDKNTKSGQLIAEKVKSGEITKEQAEIELTEAKAENWKQLIEDGTLGYLALLRNLRNITTVASDDVFTKALNMLVDEKRVRKSLVFPHQIDIAFEILMNFYEVPQNRRNPLLTAINKAYELAIPNLSELFTHGRTAVVVDTSGSMRMCSVNMNINNSKRTNINSKVIDKASLIGATLAKGIGADLYSFDYDCRKMSYNPLDTINTIKNSVIQRTTGGATIFSSIFSTLDGKYDRVFVISDMQGGDTILKNSSYQSYVRKYGQPYIYSIDLQGYGTTMFKQNQKLINLYGYSADIYEQIKSCEINPKAILAEIRKIII
ncbi:MAG TPA: TROVE domain-containing protein [Bacilli bacterium]|nr:TROVE domain-containing protein [Bacilli bacterium]